MVLKNDWKKGLKSTVWKVLIVGIPLVTPILLNLMGQWKDVTLGALLALLVKFLENQYKHI